MQKINEYSYIIKSSSINFVSFLSLFLFLLLSCLNYSLYWITIIIIIIFIHIHLFLSLWNIILLLTITVLVSILWWLFFCFGLLTKGLPSYFLIFIYIILKVDFNRFWIHFNILSRFFRSLIFLHLIRYACFIFFRELISAIILNFLLFLLLIFSLAIWFCTCLILLFFIVIRLVSFIFLPFLFLLTFFRFLLICWSVWLVRRILLLLALRNLSHLYFWINNLKLYIWIYSYTFVAENILKYPSTNRHSYNCCWNHHGC